MLLKKFTFPLILVIGTLTACVSDNPQTSSRLPIGTFERPVSPSPSSTSQKRLALLIGNSDYLGRNALTNPVNDAKALAKVLKEPPLHFEVIYKTNLNRKAMRKAIREFGEQLERNPGVGLFYFSGHGLQYLGKNHLIPIGAEDSLESAIDLKEGSETVTVNYVLEHMKAAANEVNLVILDACRNPPTFVKSLYKGEMIDPGMAKQSNTPSGTLIAYAAAPGRVALSGEGQDYSPYVKSLMAWLPKPNLSITDALTQVRNEVKQATYEQQEPEYTVALDEIFYLNWDNRVVENYRTEQARLEAEKERIARDKAAIAEERARLQAEKQRFAEQQIITPLPPIDNRFVAGKVFRDRLKDGSQGPEMVMIPAGRFRMGDIQGVGYDDDEQPVHSVSVKRFAMGSYEITFAEYDRFAKATGQTLPDDNGWGRGNQPVINVSWNDVTAYAEWLSEQTGQNYRLPTEAEWEYAARAGTSTRYWWGNEIGSNKANCDSDCGDRFDYTSPVGSFAANPFGLYDTAGNVWEWTCSEYENPYNGKEISCSNDGSLFVLRGGSWVNDAMRVRSSNRNWIRRTIRIRYYGARLARSS